MARDSSTLAAIFHSYGKKPGRRKGCHPYQYYNLAPVKLLPVLKQMPNLFGGVSHSQEGKNGNEIS